MTIHSFLGLHTKVCGGNGSLSHTYGWVAAALLGGGEIREVRLVRFQRVHDCHARAATGSQEPLCSRYAGLRPEHVTKV